MKRQLNQPDRRKLVNLGSHNLFARVEGIGSPTVIIEGGLGSNSAEWWHIQDKLAQYNTVLTYDRAGYGWSDNSPNPRTLENIVSELQSLLQKLALPKPYILVGHSQGGFYLQHYARKYPKDTAGIILLDPLSPDDNRFERELSTKIYKGSGVNKIRGIKQGSVLSKIGLLPLLKPLLLKSPPFYYYKDIPDETLKVLWRHFIRKGAFDTALAEYQEFQQGKYDLNTLQFPVIPLRLIYHDSQVLINEIVQYGGLTVAEATQVEKLWEKILREYLSLSPDHQWLVAEGSSHFIQFARPDLVIQTTLDLVRASAITASCPEVGS
jgi:pimeloyl-ACP methyl ester carboxylesterase